MAWRRRSAERVARIPGAADVHLAQVPEQPELKIDVDRTMAGQSGLTERDVASDLLVSLASSAIVAPSYWLDKRGVQYLVAVQTPQHEINSLDALKTTPISTGSQQPQLLSNVATISRTGGPVNITHYNVARTYDVQANVDGTDLGSVADAVARIVDELRPSMPRGTTARIKGQVESMQSSFRGLGYGLIFAVVLVYLLMVVNFQSWLDPLVILMALPGRNRGNRLDAVPHAHDAQRAGADGLDHVRRRGDGEQHPGRHLRQRSAQGRLATADARRAGRRDDPLPAGDHDRAGDDLGMLPMSLGLGEGGEQNAPARPGGRRRAAPRDRHHAVLRSGDVQHPPSEAAGVNRSPCR